MSMKNPLTPAGIEPATFRFVAQRLNHCGPQDTSISLPFLAVDMSGTVCLKTLQIPIIRVFSFIFIKTNSIE